MNQSKHAHLSDQELETVAGGGVSSRIPNTTNAPQGGSGPAGSQNPGLGAMGAGVNALEAVWGFIIHHM